LAWLEELVQRRQLPAMPLALEAIGMATLQYKVLLWRRASLVLPESYRRPEVAASIEAAIQMAEQVAGIIRGSALALRPRSLSLPAEKKSALAAALKRDYWSWLEEAFARWLAALDEVPAAEALADWL